MATRSTTSEPGLSLRTSETRNSSARGQIAAPLAGALPTPLEHEREPQKLEHQQMFDDQTRTSEGTVKAAIPYGCGERSVP